ncbi:MAG TPA: methyltransferase domain-containing protein [Noviherbaspirillum sp.]|uniref:class I SAM-dependent methyltransferase n=1 Tax=Noviherbaspirillum sp. TaxID=1926288 RepID=UPI002DDCC8D2|nr:methyltransferase domain-containing protein [Noviherbaspirillum sp.]HEV2609198.1 methyltransferase domain-containing protein [Noviherbaspirillum sp.]
MDLGAGGGRDSHALVCKGWQVMAIDPSPSAAAALRKRKLKGVTVVAGVLQDARARTNSIDLVNAQWVMPFIQGNELEKTIKEVARILRPGGYFCASFFGTEHSWNDGRHPRMTFHDEQAVNELLHAAGLATGRTERHAKSRKAGNGEMVPNWDEILVLARKPESTRRSSISGLAQRLRAAAEVAARNMRIPASAGDSVQPRRHRATKEMTPG